MDDDGLLMRESGEWIKRKHHFLDRYCNMFTQSMKGKWHRLYIDVMAGPGRCRIKSSGEICPGSPLSLWRETLTSIVSTKPTPPWWMPSSNGL